MVGRLMKKETHSTAEHMNGQDIDGRGTTQKGYHLVGNPMERKYGCR